MDGVSTESLRIRRQIWILGWAAGPTVLGSLQEAHGKMYLIMGQLPWCGVKLTF